MTIFDKKGVRNMSDFEYRTNDDSENSSVTVETGDVGSSQDSGAPDINENGRYRYSRESYGDGDGRYEGSNNDYSYAGSGRYHSENDGYEPYGTEPGKRKRKRSGGGFAPKAVKFVGAALVFGLVAGVAFNGVGMVRERFFPSSATSQRIETTDANDSNDSSNSSGGAISDQDVSEIVAKVMPSVVSITGTFKVSGYYGFGTTESQGAGSGFLIADDDKKLMIATNNHVVEDATSLTVGFSDDTTAPAEIVGTDSDADLAVISVKKEDVSADTFSKIKVATLGSSDSLKVGEAVIAIGNELGYGQSVTTGVVSAKDREVSFTDGTMTLLQTDAAINPGNSGGILINLKGQVVGINNAKLEDTSVEGMGYASPISTAKTILNDLMNAEAISDKEAAYLGIVGKTIDSSYSQALGMPSGIYVSQVITDSPAEKAGISAGDIITGFEGNKVSTMDGLKEKLSIKKANTKVKITVKRANQNGEYEEKEIEVTLGKASDYEDASQNVDDSTEGRQNNDDNNGNSPYDYYYNGNGNGRYSDPFDYFFNN